tara:strand:+ start:101283 stop:103910 length:2628 start_codon:yes stop_codon:yes gene_type:complete
MNTCFSYAQNYPGGVTGAEVWYIGNWDDMGSNEFINSAQTDIKINKCGEFEIEKSLFNFNPSIFTDKLCLEYMSPLENTTGRNVFFVGEPMKPKPSISHLGTLWRQEFDSAILIDSIIRNFFDFNNKNSFTKRIYDDYSSEKNANVNFYHTNNYNIDKKFKSYGQEGETNFYIGKPTEIDSDISYEDDFFYGNFPEFISFPRELSDNERNRVESYLALKYGLTLYNKESYISSKNLVFWSSSNNKIFSSNIFGFGKDDISGLNQLQSQSTHLKKHLISAIGNIVENNDDKQELVNIPNNHFLLFGDNGGETEIVNHNSKGIKFWKKTWLSQRTGKGTNDFPIHFKLYLPDETINYLNNNPSEKLWLLQDKNIGNDEISNFDSEYINYHLGDVNFDNGEAYFKDVHFDTDFNVYDQFTFGVGPEMIVQAHVLGCKKDKLEVVLDITGGQPKYHIIVEGDFEDFTEDTSYSFPAEFGDSYHIIVQDEQGLVSQINIIVEGWDFDLYLGPDQFLSDSVQQITLDAGQNISDPDATYEWYFNNSLLPFTENTLVVTEPGEYEVLITSGDLSCSISDSIIIDTLQFNANITTISACNEEFNSISIILDQGVSPFITTITGTTGASINYAHNDSTNISNIAYGTYSLNIVDSAGATFQSIVTFEPPTEMDIYSQLLALCYGSDCLINNSEYPEGPMFIYDVNNGAFSIDASIGVSNSNMTYEWFQNDISLGIIGPIITFESGADCYNGTDGLPIFTVVATDEIANCSQSQSFVTRFVCPRGNNQAITNESNHLKNQVLNLNTKVYPNPSEPYSNFTYQAEASVKFDGSVEIFTVTGALIYQTNVKGNSKYKLSMSLKTAGMYLIKLTSSTGIIKTDRIIIK